MVVSLFFFLHGESDHGRDRGGARGRASSDFGVGADGQRLAGRVSSRYSPLVTSKGDIAAGRFKFGANWSDYADRITEARIAEAEQSLAELMGRRRLDGLRFLDIGCGSGLFSLAARRLGARVHSFDFDHESVACSQHVRGKYWPSDSDWTIEQGSVLDRPYLERIGQFDVVYAWGVLHHTGDMWTAIENACQRVTAGGALVIALYRRTRTCGFWTAEKRFYASASPLTQTAIRVPYQAAYLLRIALSGKNPASFVRNYSCNRGMTFQNDTHDWLGGYPYESTTPDEVVRFLTERGLRVEHLPTLDPGWGFFGTHCDEYVFRAPEGYSSP
jgi:SAM-dependent methyltransferase